LQWPLSFELKKLGCSSSEINVTLEAQLKLTVKILDGLYFRRRKDDLFKSLLLRNECARDSSDILSRFSIHFALQNARSDGKDKANLPAGRQVARPAEALSKEGLRQKYKSVRTLK